MYNKEKKQADKRLINNRTTLPYLSILVYLYPKPQDLAPRLSSLTPCASSDGQRKSNQRTAKMRRVNKKNRERREWKGVVKNKGGQTNALKELFPPRKRERDGKV